MRGLAVASPKDVPLTVGMRPHVDLTVLLTYNLIEAGRYEEALLLAQQIGSPRDLRKMMLRLARRQATSGDTAGALATADRLVGISDAVVDRVVGVSFEDDASFQAMNLSVNYLVETQLEVCALKHELGSGPDDQEVQEMADALRQKLRLPADAEFFRLDYLRRWRKRIGDLRGANVALDRAISSARHAMLFRDPRPYLESIATALAEQDRRDEALRYVQQLQRAVAAIRSSDEQYDSVHLIAVIALYTVAGLHSRAAGLIHGCVSQETRNMLWARVADGHQMGGDLERAWSIVRRLPPSLRDNRAKDIALCHAEAGDWPAVCGVAKECSESEIDGIVLDCLQELPAEVPLSIDDPMILHALSGELRLTVNAWLANRGVVKSEAQRDVLAQTLLDRVFTTAPTLPPIALLNCAIALGLAGRFNATAQMALQTATRSLDSLNVARGCNGIRVRAARLWAENNRFPEAAELLTGRSSPGVAGFSELPAALFPPGEAPHPPVTLERITAFVLDAAGYLMAHNRCDECVEFVRGCHARLDCLQPNDVPAGAWHSLGLALMHIGDFDRMRSVAWRLAPESQERLELECRIIGGMAMEGSFDAARAALSQLESIGRGVPEAGRMFIANELLARGRRAEGLRLLDETAASVDRMVLNPKLSHFGLPYYRDVTFSELSKAYAKAGQFESAHTWADRIKLDPSQPFRIDALCELAIHQARAAIDTGELFEEIYRLASGFADRTAVVVTIIKAQIESGRATEAVARIPEFHLAPAGQLENIMKILADAHQGDLILQLVPECILQPGAAQMACGHLAMAFPDQAEVIAQLLMS